jgi:hypothetical protein
MLLWRSFAKNRIAGGGAGKIGLFIWWCRQATQSMIGFVSAQLILRIFVIGLPEQR